MLPSKVNKNPKSGTIRQIRSNQDITERNLWSEVLISSCPNFTAVQETWGQIHHRHRRHRLDLDPKVSFLRLPPWKPGDNRGSLATHCFGITLSQFCSFFFGQKGSYATSSKSWRIDFLNWTWRCFNCHIWDWVWWIQLWTPRNPPTWALKSDTQEIQWKSQESTRGSPILGRLRETKKPWKLGQSLRRTALCQGKCQHMLNICQLFGSWMSRTSQHWKLFGGTYSAKLSCV